MNMEIKKLVFSLFLLLIAGGLSLTSCKKESSTSGNNSLTSQQITQSQNTDAQDAVAEKTE